MRNNLHAARVKPPPSGRLDASRIAAGAKLSGGGFHFSARLACRELQNASRYLADTPAASLPRLSQSLSAVSESDSLPD